MTDYSRGDYADLPAGTTDLENNYTAPDLTAIASNDNSTYAEQTANNEIAIHQYKKTVTGQYTNITWSGKSSLAPSESPVIMEVYNITGTAWEELDRDDSTAADTDFDIIYNNLATADYLDTGVITWRVYQAASGAAPSWVFFDNHIANKSITSLITLDGAWHQTSSLVTAGIVPADATGVILHITNSATDDTTQSPCDVRPHDSSYTDPSGGSYLKMNCHKYLFAKLDSGTFDAKMTSTMNVYVSGYTRESTSQFALDPTDITPGTYDGSFQTVTRAAGKASICTQANAEVYNQFGWRQFGDSYSHINIIPPNTPQLTLLPLDTSFRGEISDNSADQKWYDWGYINKYSHNSNATDKTPALTGWQTVDVSAIAPAGAVGVEVLFYRINDIRKNTLRNYGDTDNYTVDCKVWDHRNFTAVCGLTDNKFDVYLEDLNDNINLYILGFFLA